MLRIMMTWLGTIASVFGLLYSLRPSPKAGLTTGQAVWLGVLVVVFAMAVTAEILEHLRHRPKRYRSRKAINKYMHRWISRGDRVVIFTRDMTWAHDSAMRDLLIAKASKRELTICLPTAIPLTNDLASFGAEILEYPDLHHIPLSRFTIINVGRGDTQVAIGSQVKGVHVIEEFAAGDHPAFHIAHDLVEVIRKVAR